MPHLLVGLIRKGTHDHLARFTLTTRMPTHSTNRLPKHAGFLWTRDAERRPTGRD